MVDFKDKINHKVNRLLFLWDSKITFGVDEVGIDLYLSYNFTEERN